MRSPARHARRRGRRTALVGAVVLLTPLVGGAAVVALPPVGIPATAPAARPAPEPTPAADLAPEPQRIARAITLEPRPEPKPKPAAPPKPKPTAAPAPEPAPPAPEPVADVSFTIGSFNVLGSSHTRGRGGMAPGPERIRRAADLLRAHDVSIAGLQELQPDQFRRFTQVAGGTYGAFPGLSRGPLGVENSIVWRKAEWSVEQASTVQIPYFDGRLRPMPYLLLRHTATGRKVWVANFHNPATNKKRGNQDRHRVRAAIIETQLANRLWRETGYPVFVVGDMNDREKYFCRMTAGAPMQAANGGSNDGACRPPSYPMPVDWIFGSLTVDFSGYVRDEGQQVRRTSDHPMIRADVLLDGFDGLAGAD